MKHIVKHFNIHAKAENENRSQTFWGQTRMRLGSRMILDSYILLTVCI